MRFVRTTRDEFDRREAASARRRRARYRARVVWSKVLECWDSAAECKEFLMGLEEGCGKTIKRMLHPAEIKNPHNWRNRKKRNSLPEHLRSSYGSREGKENLTEHDLAYIPTRADIRLLEKFIPAWSE